MTRFPWGPLAMSTVLSCASLIAIFAFGAPLLTLVIVGFVGLTLSEQMRSRVQDRSGRG